MARQDATVTPQITHNSTSPLRHAVRHTVVRQDTVVVVEISKDTCVAARTQRRLKPTRMPVRLLLRGFLEHIGDWQI